MTFGFYLCRVCVCVFMHESAGLHRSEEGIRSPGDGVTGGEEMLTCMLGMTSGSP